jgi:hypothetical protein
MYHSSEPSNAKINTLKEARNKALAQTTNWLDTLVFYQVESKLSKLKQEKIGVFFENYCQIMPFFGQIREKSNLVLVYADKILESIEKNRIEAVECVQIKQKKTMDRLLLVLKTEKETQLTLDIISNQFLFFWYV